MPKDCTLSSPNYIVWQLFEALRRLRIRTKETHFTQDAATLRQDAALCVILAVQCVEVFFNIYFPALISEPNYAHAADQISTDLQKIQFGEKVTDLFIT